MGAVLLGVHINLIHRLIKITLKMKTSCPKSKMVSTHIQKGPTHIGIKAQKSQISPDSSALGSILDKQTCREMILIDNYLLT